MNVFLDHVAINAHDPDALTRFYVEVVGLAPERWARFRAGEVLFPSVRLNADTILDFFPPALWQGKGPQSGPGCANVNHLCLGMSTGEWTSLGTRLEAANVDIVMGPGRRWGARGDGISIYFHDPEGNLVEARHYPELRTAQDTDDLES